MNRPRDQLTLYKKNFDNLINRHPPLSNNGRLVNRKVFNEYIQSLDPVQKDTLLDTLYLTMAQGNNAIRSQEKDTAKLRSELMKRKANTPLEELIPKRPTGLSQIESIEYDLRSCLSIMDRVLLISQNL